MDYDDQPKRIMACAPFLQRMGWVDVRPEQNFNLNFAKLHVRKYPAEYPQPGVQYPWGYREEEPLHGLSTLQPYNNTLKNRVLSQCPNIQLHYSPKNHSSHVTGL
jgi:hypothetical protein